MLDCVIFLHLSLRLLLSCDEPHTGVTESFRLRGSMASSKRESRATSPTACARVHRDLAGHPSVKPRRGRSSRGGIPKEVYRAWTGTTRHFDRRSETECAAVRAKAWNVGERVGSGCHPLLARSFSFSRRECGTPRRGMERRGRQGTGGGIDDSLGSTSGMFGASAH